MSKKWYEGSNFSPNSLKKIPLTRGKYALVDDEDYAELSKYKWTCSVNGYAVRRDKGSGKGDRSALAHDILVPKYHGEFAVLNFPTPQLYVV